MKEKKYIDRLYQEKFRDFEATPSEAVWRNISAKLQEKDRRRPVITPFWSRMAGIAAIFTLILLIGEWMFPVKTGTQVVSDEVEESFNNSLPANNSGIAANPEEEEEFVEDSSEVIVANTQNIRTLASSERAANRQKKSPEIASLQTGKSKKISSGTNGITAGEMSGEQEAASPEIDKKKSLFDEINKQEEAIAEETSKEKFEVSTHAAPIYYGNFGKGNFLDPRFNNNSSEGEITYSYGINIAYAISDKIKIRSGVNKVNMSYNTNGITYQSVVGPVPISGISMDSKSEEPRVSGELGTSKPVASTNRPGVGVIRPGLLNQKMGFIEVPVELEYNLIRKKFELNIIGGASTLFLDENRISVNSGNMSAEGRANNLNEVSFSTNLGLGLDYNLSEKFKLNLEPMLKYQVNTFNTSSSDNQPYYLGIYSGFSYKF